MYLVLHTFGSPGGLVDQAARRFAPLLAKRTGYENIVSNSGPVRQIEQSKDHRNFLIASPGQMAKFSTSESFDFRNTFRHCAAIGRNRTALIASKSSGVRSLK